jgi:hypothetical protein
MWDVRTELYPGLGVKPARSTEFSLTAGLDEDLVAYFMFDEGFFLLNLSVTTAGLLENDGNVLGGLSQLFGILPLAKLVAAEYARKSVGMNACEVFLGELNYSADFAREMVDCW